MGEREMYQPFQAEDRGEGEEKNHSAGCACWRRLNCDAWEARGGGGGVVVRVLLKQPARPVIHLV